jgi:hypothetical protein
MTGEINGTTMRVVLQSLKSVSGPQYEMLLQRAGLTRFIKELPAADGKTAATGEELVRLFTVVYTMLGEVCTRLFHRNCGVAYAEGIMQSGWGATMRAKAPTIPADQKFNWMVRELTALAEHSYSPQIVTEDAAAWYLASTACYVCTGLQGVKAPICTSTETMYKELAKKMLGRTVRVVEVECVALGAPHCKFAIYK